ncbi:hypothetical protein K9N68_34125 (plasmid) [Kovacikia minuta CCNUW1]|uniref:hypothetical protein n=1 Tax=Kovacikia minuta TaxID=2931930 RepID=UPI001CCF7D10|nr:hypothetical protein [Kovacikia minuta]UBF30256.1 hypothetical protein K9N68_34125 [Kovacikia minuta CCNUW1]
MHGKQRLLGFQLTAQVSGCNWTQTLKRSLANPPHCRVRHEPHRSPPNYTSPTIS